VAPAEIVNPWLDERYACPQTLVRIGRRRRLNLLIAGEGAPTVIFAAGMNGATLHWARVQRVVAEKTRTVAFDKAGLGFSDPGPLPRNAGAIVDDLRAALKAAGIGPPYVLVGHSAGGPQMRLFAFRHPEEVVGMVMVDSSGEYQDRRIAAAMGDGDRDLSAVRREMLGAYSRLTRLARAGALTPGTTDYDLAVGPPLRTVTPAVWNALVAQHTSPGFWRAMRSESAAFNSISSDQVTAARQALGGAPPLGDMPIVVLTAGKNAAPRGEESAEVTAARHAAWCAIHDEIAALSTRGVRRTIDAGHSIQVEKPDVVIAAIEEVLASAKQPS
jgi:pimeloyl-ACP methyl ester carboxylesterase